MGRGALHNKEDGLLQDDSSREALFNKFALFAISAKKGKPTVWMQPARRCKTAKLRSALGQPLSYCLQ